MKTDGPANIYAQCLLVRHSHQRAHYFEYDIIAIQNAC
jgi:hypothetical protein